MQPAATAPPCFFWITTPATPARTFSISLFLPYFLFPLPHTTSFPYPFPTPLHYHTCIITIPLSSLPQYTHTPPFFPQDFFPTMPHLPHLHDCLAKLPFYIFFLPGITTYISPLPAATPSLHHLMMVFLSPHTYLTFTHTPDRPDWRTGILGTGNGRGKRNLLKPFLKPSPFRPDRGRDR